MFGDDKLQRAIDAQAKINELLMEQHIGLNKMVVGMHDRLAAAEREHIGFKYALAALATVVRCSSDKNRDMLKALLDAAIAGLPASLRDDEKFLAGITALRDENTFSVG